MLEYRSNGAVLREFVTLKDARVLDIGAGAGALTRYMTKHGAHVTGLEYGRAQLEKARATKPVADERYIEGVGQDLPFADAEFDIAVYFNALHHVPVQHMAAALREAARVIKPGGTLYVAEPLASGTGFELHAPIDDETAVRDAAYEALKDTRSHGLTETSETFYDTAYHYADFAAFKEECIRIDPARRARFQKLADELRQRFETLGVPEERGIRFDQPMRVNVLFNTPLTQR